VPGSGRTATGGSLGAGGRPRPSKRRRLEADLTRHGKMRSFFSFFTLLPSNAISLFEDCRMRPGKICVSARLRCAQGGALTKEYEKPAGGQDG
jgi:hypothetical protein